jgi:hypothetical protein
LIEEQKIVKKVSTLSEYWPATKAINANNEAGAQGDRQEALTFFCQIIGK